jgi:hypothetical protein
MSSKRSERGQKSPRMLSVMSNEELIKPKKSQKDKMSDALSSLRLSQQRSKINKESLYEINKDILSRRSENSQVKT